MPKNPTENVTAEASNSPQQTRFIEVFREGLNSTINKLIPVLLEDWPEKDDHLNEKLKDYLAKDEYDILGWLYFHWKSEMPNSRSSLKNHLVYIKNKESRELYYIDFKEEANLIRLKDSQAFEQKIGKIRRKEEEKIHLTPEQIKELISDNGDYNPLKALDLTLIYLFKKTFYDYLSTGSLHIRHKEIVETIRKLIINRENNILLLQTFLDFWTKPKTKKDGGEWKTNSANTLLFTNLFRLPFIAQHQLLSGQIPLDLIKVIYRTILELTQKVINENCSGDKVCSEKDKDLTHKKQEEWNQRSSTLQNSEANKISGQLTSIALFTNYQEALSFRQQNKESGLQAFYLKKNNDNTENAWQLFYLDLLDRKNYVRMPTLLKSFLAKNLKHHLVLNCKGKEVSLKSTLEQTSQELNSVLTEFLLKIETHCQAFLKENTSIYLFSGDEKQKAQEFAKNHPNKQSFYLKFLRETRVEEANYSLQTAGETPEESSIYLKYKENSDITYSIWEPQNCAVLLMANAPQGTMIALESYNQALIYTITDHLFYFNRSPQGMELTELLAGEEKKYLRVAFLDYLKNALVATLQPEVLANKNQDVNLNYANPLVLNKHETLKCLINSLTQQQQQEILSLINSANTEKKFRFNPVEKSGILKANQFSNASWLMLVNLTKNNAFRRDWQKKLILDENSTSLQTLPASKKPNVIYLQLVNSEIHYSVSQPQTCPVLQMDNPIQPYDRNLSAYDEALIISAPEQRLFYFSRQAQGLKLQELFASEEKKSLKESTIQYLEKLIQTYNQSQELATSNPFVKDKHERIKCLLPTLSLTHKKELEKIVNIAADKQAIPHSQRKLFSFLTVEQKGSLQAHQFSETAWENLVTAINNKCFSPKNLSEVLSVIAVPTANHLDALLQKQLLKMVLTITASRRDTKGLPASWQLSGFKQCGKEFYVQIPTKMQSLLSEYQLANNRLIPPIDCPQAVLLSEALNHIFKEILDKIKIVVDPDVANHKLQACFAIIEGINLYFWPNEPDETNPAFSQMSNAYIITRQGRFYLYESSSLTCLSNNLSPEITDKINNHFKLKTVVSDKPIRLGRTSLSEEDLDFIEENTKTRASAKNELWWFDAVGNWQKIENIDFNQPLDQLQLQLRHLSIESRQVAQEKRDIIASNLQQRFGSPTKTDHASSAPKEETLIEANSPNCFFANQFDSEPKQVQTYPPRSFVLTYHQQKQWQVYYINAQQQAEPLNLKEYPKIVEKISQWPETVDDIGACDRLEFSALLPKNKLIKTEAYSKLSDFLENHFNRSAQKDSAKTKKVEPIISPLEKKSPAFFNRINPERLQKLENCLKPKSAT